MDIILADSFLQRKAIALIALIAATLLAGSDKPGWGWFLFAAVIMSH